LAQRAIRAKFERDRPSAIGDRFVSIEIRNF